MKSLRRFLALVLLLLIFPEAGEAVENIAHLLGHGHSAHAQGTSDEHAPSGREHDCTGTFHLCSCCPAAAAIVSVGPNMHGSVLDAMRAISWVLWPVVPELPTFVPPPRQ